MNKRILVMGLPGAGKTTFSQQLVRRLMITHTVAWFNADSVRQEYNDWDFSPEGRQRQVDRMIALSKNSSADFVICDFVCPTEDLRNRFSADIVIWIDTIREGRFEDTNRVFVTPYRYTYRLQHWDDTDFLIRRFVEDVVNRRTETNMRSLAKAVSWRVLGSVDTFILSWIVTGQLKLAVAIGGIEIFTKIGLYWLHERVWQKIKLR